MARLDAASTNRGLDEAERILDRLSNTDPATLQKLFTLLKEGISSIRGVVNAIREIFADDKEETQS